MATHSHFAFDGDYGNVEQVRPFKPAYDVVRARLDASGQYPYNESFRGRIPGIEGPGEDTAIYLLQTMHGLDALTARVADYLAAGGVRVETLTEPTRFASVAHVGFYMGGTGWTEWSDARIVPRAGRPHAVIPKGKRTHGHLLDGGYVLARTS